MKICHHFIHYNNHECDYATYLHRIVTRLVTYPVFLLFFIISSKLLTPVNLLIGINSNALIASLKVNVGRQEKEVVDIDDPLVLKSECPELLFIPTFKGVSMLLTLIP